MGWISSIIILGLSFFILNSYIKNKDHVFEPEQIVVLGKKVAVSGVSFEEKLQRVIDTLEKRFPGHILPASQRRWIFTKTGGWLGSTLFLHISLTEYLKVYGTPVTTQGHSGRHFANITDVVITGWVSQWKEGMLRAAEFGPGKEISLASGESAAVEWKAGTWVIEYGRGFTPLMMGYSLTDTVFSTADMFTVFKMIKMYCTCVFTEMFHQVNEYAVQFFNRS